MPEAKAWNLKIYYDIYYVTYFLFRIVTSYAFVYSFNQQGCEEKNVFTKKLFPSSAWPIHSMKHFQTLSSRSSARKKEDENYQENISKTVFFNTHFYFALRTYSK